MVFRLPCLGSRSEVWRREWLFGGRTYGTVRWRMLQEGRKVVYADIARQYILSSRTWGRQEGFSWIRSLKLDYTRR